jgi:hypothetical protein
MQGDHWKIATDVLHVVLLAAMFTFGIVACILYFRVTAKLESAGEPVPGIFERKDVFRVLRRYRELAGRYSWPIWPVHAQWVAVLLALVCGLIFVYWR